MFKKTFLGPTLRILVSQGQVQGLPGKLIKYKILELLITTAFLFSKRELKNNIIHSQHPSNLLPKKQHKSANNLGNCEMKV